jgi:hypothetical protein
MLRIRDAPEEVQITLYDLEEMTRLLLEIAAAQREHGPAATREMEQRFYERFGKHWDSGKRVRGRLRNRRPTERLPNASPSPKTKQG